jgi:hypothetical protein
MVRREEVVERIEQDDGDPTDEVHKWRDARAHIYHEDSECPYVEGKDPVTMSRREAHERKLGGCRLCVLDDVEYNHRNEQPQELIESARQSIEARLD